MAVVLVEANDQAPVYGPRLRDAEQARPAHPAVRIAVGVESDGSWISAQWGELAIRKDTRSDPLETTVHLCRGADGLTLDVRGAVVAVTRGAAIADSTSCDAHARMRALLASSPAVTEALDLGEALRRLPEIHVPEGALLSTVDLLRALLGGGDWRWFRDDEARWAEELNGVRPQKRAA